MSQSEPPPRGAFSPGLSSAAGDRIDQPAHRRDRMDGLVKAMLVVGSGLDLDATLRRIVQAAVELTGCCRGAVGVLDREGEGPAEFATDGAEEEIRVLIGQPSTEHRRPLRIDDPSQGARFLSVPILVHDELFGHLHLAEKPGGLTFTEDDETTVRALAAVAGVAIENARLHEEARLRERWQEATLEIRAELLGAVDTDDILQLITDRVLALTEAHYAFIVRPEDPACLWEEHAKLVVTVAAGPDIDWLTGQEIPVEGSPCGRALVQATPLRVPTVPYGRSATLDECFGPGLVLPMYAADGAVFGALVAVRKTGESPFDAQLVPLASAFADEAAIALQRAADERRLYEMRVSAERDRIARDLHDHVIQRLFAHGLALQVALQKTRSDDIRSRITGQIDEVQAIIADIRAAIFDLYRGLQGGLDGGACRLRRRLRKALDELTAESGLRTTIRMSGPIGVVGPELADHGEAVLREAVTNVVRHAKATALIVSVSLDDDLVIDVTDDGLGISPLAGRSGLRTLAERAEEAGGEFSVKALTAGGTRLVWSAPFIP